MPSASSSHSHPTPRRGRPQGPSLGPEPGWGEVRWEKVLGWRCGKLEKSEGKGVSERCCFWPPALSRISPPPLLRAPRAGESGAPGPALAPRRAACAPRRSPPQVTAPPLGDLPWRASPGPLEPNTLPGEEDGFTDLPLKNTPFFSLCLHLHPSSRLSAHSLSPYPRDLGRPGANFSANFATGADERLGFRISQICKTLRSGESTEGLSARVPFPEPARRGCRRGRESCTGLGTSSPVRGVLSPDLGLMGTNEREAGSVNHRNIQANC